jgi:hypothetical protein
MATNLSTTFFYETNADKRGEVRVKPAFEYDSWALKVGGIHPPSPFAAKVNEGKKFYDVVCLQDVHNFAFSDRIHTLLIHEGITGWRSYPLVIEGHEEKKYWGIQVLGKAGPIYRPQKGFVEGIDFDRSTWDGSDMFILEGTASTLVTERLRDLLVKHKTSNLQLDEISTIRWYSTTADD